MIALLLLTLQADLADLAKKSGSTVGIYVEHLERHETAGVHATRKFAMASTFKLPLAIVVMRDVERKKLPPLDGNVRLLPGDMRPWASPLFERMGAKGGEATLREVVTSMLLTSDNSAADALLRLCGGPARVTAELRALKLDDISIDRNEGEIDAAGRAGADRKAALARLLADPRDHATPPAMARVFIRLFRGELLTPENTRLVMDGLLRCQTGKNRLRAGMPAQTGIADRTGTCGGTVCANDIALVTLPSGDHVVIAALVEDLNGAKESVLAEIGKLVWNTYAR
jgi:beta-lactamase class A